MGTDDLSDLRMTETDSYRPYDWVFHDVVVADPVTGEAMPDIRAGCNEHADDVAITAWRWRIRLTPRPG